jgi:transposase
MHFNKIYKIFTQKINLKDKALNRCINSILIKNFAKLVSNTSKNITNKQRLHVYYEDGFRSPQEVHKITRIPLRTIARNISKFRKGEGPERKVGTGRPPKLSANDRRRVHQLAVKHEQWPAARIAVRAAKLGSPLVGKKTIQRVLKNQGFLKLVPKIVPPLSEEQKKMRVKWCQKYRNLDFSKVCFSDEAKFQFHRNIVKVWCKKRKSKEVPKWSPSVMVWGK